MEDCCENEPPIVPVGIKGDKGAKGDSPVIQIGTVETLPPTEPAEASLTQLSPNVYALNLGIPKGDPGSFGMGENGEPGADGISPAITAVEVSFVASDQPGAAMLMGPQTGLTLKLSIPKGEKGEKGDFASIPRGVVWEYEGSMSNFDSTGLGTGPMLGWALCNGQNGTSDRRGTFTVGYDPTKPNTPAVATSYAQKNYGAIGNRGGEDAHKLSLSELPKFKITFPTVGYAGISGTGLRLVGNALSPPGPDVQSPEIGGDQFHENRPTYYVSARIFKL